MTVCGESQEESRSPITLSSASFITPRSTLRGCCWNIRMLFQVGKIANAMKEFKSSGMDILGLSEM